MSSMTGIIYRSMDGLDFDGKCMHVNVGIDAKHGAFGYGVKKCHGILLLTKKPRENESGAG